MVGFSVSLKDFPIYFNPLSRPGRKFAVGIWFPPTKSSQMQRGWFVFFLKALNHRGIAETSGTATTKTGKVEIYLDKTVREAERTKRSQCRAEQGSRRCQTSSRHCGTLSYGGRSIAARNSLQTDHRQDRHRASLGLRSPPFPLLSKEGGSAVTGNSTGPDKYREKSMTAFGRSWPLSASTWWGQRVGLF